MKKEKELLWIDLDNAPHVPLFRPIFSELNRKNYEHIVTSRDFTQTTQLLKLWQIEHIPVGSHAGKNKIKKVLNLFQRASQLKRIIKSKNVKTAISHGSRSQLLAAKQMAIKSILMLDYEFTETKIINCLSTHILIPSLIPDKRLSSAGINLNKVIRYNGFKEELYLNHFQPIDNFRRQIGITKDQVLVVIRPPSMVSNYHNPKSEGLLISALNYFSSHSNAMCLVVNRTITEKEFIISKIKLKENIRFLEKVVDGLQLLYAADITISGGGTMKRETSVFGNEKKKIFTSRRPPLHEELEKKRSP